MMNLGWFSRSSNQQPSSARVQRIAGGFGVAVLLLTMGIAVAQNPGDPEPGATMSIPAGYSFHSSVDFGGRITDNLGSGAMYDTLVNLQSGPRLLGQTFEMRALPSNKHSLFDNLSTFSTGYGGDPYNYTKFAVDKGKLYDFSGLFRRDRQYADYDLIGNPMIVTGYSVPIGPSAAPTGQYAWPQVMDSPFLFNTVRRMTDVKLTLLPVSKISFVFGYSQNIFQGPSRTPSGNAVAGQEVILEEYQRNSMDDFMGAVNWKPVQGTQLTYEEQIDHYRGDSWFVMDPTYYTVQEPDGTPVALLDSYQNQYPYGYSSAGAFAASTNCNTSSMISATTILRANPTGGLPIIDPACNVISSYLRMQPTREIYPTEIFRLQSSSLTNVTMNGNIRYTNANLNLPNYFEEFQGLQKANRELATSGNAHTRRQVMAVDYGIVWQATKTVAIEDQLNFSNAHQPGTANFTGGTTETVPTTAGAETINNTNLTVTSPATGAAGPGAPGEGGPSINGPQSGYFGQRFVINNFTVSWDATPTTTLSLTYRHGNHIVTEGANISVPVPNCVSPKTNAEQAYCGTVTINEDGGILNAAVRPASNWELNGTVELIFDDNVFTPVAPRQTQHYRIHTIYRPRPWATLSGAYNDLERHNNTNNTGVQSFAADGVTPMQIQHRDHTRILSMDAALYPNEHYGFDIAYAYTDVYTSTNTCFQAAATFQPNGGDIPGAAVQTTPGFALLCGTVPNESGHGTTVFIGPTPDFSHSPTQFGSVSVTYAPVDRFRWAFGYRENEINGTRLFTQAQEVIGSLVSTYKFPFADLAVKVRPDLTFKVDYNFYEYGEGGQSGSQYCNNNPTITTAYLGTSIPVVPCSSLANTAMSPGTPAYGFTAPRDFRGNSVVIGAHYEF